ncbi:MAG: sulfate adenylyltransferase [Armatimonadetes bacterium]|nr:sulfate adenylyltransferase [Armatimonadota bacterium]MDW8152890.1 sulfate adenylyltransferase [Armatimonadota bacterium]
MIAPHGGELVQRTVQGERAQILREEIRRLPAVALAPKEAADAVLIATGAYSPLRGFMPQEEYRSVVREMHLPCGLPWTLPITLPIPEELARRAGRGDRLTLRAGGILAVMEVEEIYRRDLEEEARWVFGTTDRRHPGVARLLRESPWVAGGEIWLLDRPPRAFPGLERDPAETRAYFTQVGWRTVTAFQTRNPIHRAHEYLQKCALEVTDGLFLHPLVGETKEDDLPPLVRLRTYEALLEEYYPRDRVLLAAFPAAMRYAGPREAVFHALVRKNYGCTHILIGRDHAGVGGFYEPYAAHRIFDRFDPQAIGITPLFFGEAFYCRRCDAMATERSCPHPPEARVNPSGTWVRELLRAGQFPPPQVMRPEVARILLEHFVQIQRRSVERVR